jgi:hypothetical protein
VPPHAPTEFALIQADFQQFWLVRARYAAARIPEDEESEADG